MGYLFVCLCFDASVFGASSDSFIYFNLDEKVFIKIALFTSLGNSKAIILFILKKYSGYLDYFYGKVSSLVKPH